MSKITQKEYEKDFYAWIIHNAQLLREGRVSEIDVENIAEEMESMGKSEKRALASRLAVLMAHLLKWKYQPMRRSKSWVITIKNQRRELIDLLEESPSLKKELEEKFKHIYEKGVGLASAETGIDEEAFPHRPPFSLKDCLRTSYLPD
ncbi:MAG: DUF29 domain-containing protein [Gammaproteobacteria bacterium]|nr:MAG: DUF29 domain-containing protein [Gammaproteobacteria bacterium]